MDLKLEFDQSVFVKSAIESVLREGVISSILVSLMILLFLGSWRSVIVVCTSIPLAILVSVIGLNLTGNTINIMTLGGLSLAIGMLVDDRDCRSRKYSPQSLARTSAYRSDSHRLRIRLRFRRSWLRSRFASYFSRSCSSPDPPDFYLRLWRFPSSSRCSRHTSSRGRWCPFSAGCSSSMKKCTTSMIPDTRCFRVFRVFFARLQARYDALSARGARQSADRPDRRGWRPRGYDVFAVCDRNRLFSADGHGADEASLPRAPRHPNRIHRKDGRPGRRRDS